jgi:creatinine amidohydrolase
MQKEAWKMTAHAFKEGAYDKAILTLGSCEAHGDHLPLGTDTHVSYMLACSVAEKVEGMLVLPPIAVGCSAHYSGFPFTIYVSYETMVAIIKDVLRSTIKNGITKIFILNGHDGNIAPLEMAAREIKVEHPEVRIASLDAWWVSAGRLLPPDTFEVWNGLGHAGEGESSIALQLFGDWCDMAHARGVVPDHLPEHVEIKWNFSELTDCAATGDPTKATKEKGARMEKVLVDLIVDSVQRLDASGWNYTSSVSAMK